MNKGKNRFLDHHRHAICEYIRDKTTRAKRGLLIAVRANNQNGYAIGWSLYNKNSEEIRFDRAVAFGLALHRANEPEQAEVPASIVEHYAHMQQRAAKYFNNLNKEKNPNYVLIPEKVVNGGRIPAHWVQKK